MAQPNVPFKNSNDFQQAFNWNANQIFNYLSQVANGIRGSRSDLWDLFTEIILGTRTEGLRRRMTKYVDGSDTKMYLSIVSFQGLGGESMPVRISEQLGAIGFLLSETTLIQAAPGGGAPDGQNFCLPLVSMYGKWCGTICAAVNAIYHQQCCPFPTMVSCQYVWKNGALLRVFLGACISGSNYGGNRTQCKATRKGIMSSYFPGCATSEAPLLHSSSQMDWGSCSETYPFLLLHIVDAATKPCVFCLNVDVQKLLSMNAYNFANCDKCLKVSCANCMMIVRQLGGTEKNFVPGGWGAPKKS